MIAEISVLAGGDQLSPSHNDAAHGNFSGSLRFSGFRQSSFHPEFVRRHFGKIVKASGKQLATQVSRWDQVGSAEELSNLYRKLPVRLSIIVYCYCLLRVAHCGISATPLIPAKQANPPLLTLL